MADVTRIKFCGITRPEDAAAACEAGAWAIGLIFVPTSKRFVRAEHALDVCAAVAPTALKVGVFANQSATVIGKVLERVPLDLVQLHGHETNEQCDEIAALPGVGRDRLIKAVVMFDASDVERVLAYRVHHLLIDQPKEGLPDSKPEVDPALARDLVRRAPCTLLAGGLNAANVGDLIQRIRPWGVDIASGVEVRPGIKDPAAIREFAAAVRAADAIERGVSQ
ncbi:MAG: N-(5'-phosphoribosyl)anthranilate isomerase [Planctomycetota bacterium]